MTTRVITATGLRAGYVGVPVLSDVDLHIDAGEMVALLGANGAGKTTTVLSLAGALRPTAGAVDFEDAAAQRGRQVLLRRARAGLAMLPEQKAVFMGLTVRENLTLGRGSVADALNYFPELGNRIGIRAGLLSGGEQQMLALARILAAHPRLILADELSLGLAPLVVRRLLEALSEAARNGTAVLIVEQHLHTALKWTDRAYVMRRGRVELEATSAELLDRIDEVTALYI